MHDSDQAFSSVDQNSSQNEPLVIGKPNPWVIELIRKERGCDDKSKMIMIGDRMDTDMLLANRAGVDGCLVLTGVTSSESEMY